jgi:D-alanyl-D-alanine carboxypeptidase/D-alanyl-D-alanine-endopeptidase (penicillin-binding protein 4)
VQHVAEAAHGPDADAVRLELGAQARDVHLDRVGAHLLVPAAHRGDDLLLVDHLLDVAQQVLEQRPLAHRQLQRLAGQEAAARAEVHLERPVGDRLQLLRPAAADQRVGARHQLVQVEGLEQVVVGAQVQPVHAVLHRVARGQDQHRHVLAARPRAAHHLEAVQPRAAHVQHDEVEGLAAQQVVGGAPVVDPVGHEALGSERADQPVGQQGVVLHDQHSHRVIAPVVGPRQAQW